MTAEKRDYENETGLAWRGYRLLKTVTTYHTCGESPNDEAQAPHSGASK